jgi:hypothetical protein
MADWHVINQKLDEILAILKAKPLPKVKQTDEDWLAETKLAYHWVDWDTEMVKMQAWLAAHPGRKMTRTFILGWVNKIQKPVQVTVPVKVQGPPVFHKKIEERPEGEPPPPEVRETLSRLMGKDFMRVVRDGR